MDNTKDPDGKIAARAKLLKGWQDDFCAAYSKDLYTYLAKEHKIRYDCYRKEGLTMEEALRIVTSTFS